MTTHALKAAPSVREQVSTEEWERRVELAAAYRLVALYGWDDLIFTHLSVRIPGPEHHFLINPWNLMFEEITASSLVKVDVEGQPVMPYGQVYLAGKMVYDFSVMWEARDDDQVMENARAIQSSIVRTVASGCSGSIRCAASRSAETTDDGSTVVFSTIAIDGRASCVTG